MTQVNKTIENDPAEIRDVDLEQVVGGMTSSQKIAFDHAFHIGPEPTPVGHPAAPPSPPPLTPQQQLDNLLKGDIQPNPTAGIQGFPSTHINVQTRTEPN